MQKTSIWYLTCLTLRDSNTCFYKSLKRQLRNSIFFIMSNTGALPRGFPSEHQPRAGGMMWVVSESVSFKTQCLRNWTFWSRRFGEERARGFSLWEKQYQGKHSSLHEAEAEVCWESTEQRRLREQPKNHERPLSCPCFAPFLIPDRASGRVQRCLQLWPLAVLPSLPGRYQLSHCMRFSAGLSWSLWQKGNPTEGSVQVSDPDPIWKPFFQNLLTHAQENSTTSRPIFCCEIHTLGLRWWKCPALIRESYSHQSSWD